MNTNKRTCRTFIQGMGDVQLAALLCECRA